MVDVIRRIRLNGMEKTVSAAPEARLLDVIRRDLKLKGTKEGCGDGECGACSIIVNGDVINSCLKLFGQLCDGDEILTIEGLGDAEHLAPLQDCFVSEGGVQCGMCTPGMLMAAHALLMKNPNPSREEIARGMAGNLCRCTGYTAIVDAVVKAAEIGVRDPKPETRKEGKQ